MASTGATYPAVSAIVRRVALSLLLACAIPAALFYSCLRLEGVWTAIFVALGWSYGAIACRAIARRRTSGLLILTTLVMSGRTLVALLTDSTYLYFLQPIISDGLVGVAFIATLASARPMVARLAGDFYPMDDGLHLRPRIRRLFWWLTLLWALLCLGKATATLWLLESQSLETFVLVKSVSMLLLNGFAVAATIGAATLVARREGLLTRPLPNRCPSRRDLDAAISTGSDAGLADGGREVAPAARGTSGSPCAGRQLHDSPRRAGPGKLSDPVPRGAVMCAGDHDGGTADRRQCRAYVVAARDVPDTVRCR